MDSYSQRLLCIRLSIFVEMKTKQIIISMTRLLLKWANVWSSEWVCERVSEWVGGLGMGRWVFLGWGGRGGICEFCEWVAELTDGTKAIVLLLLYSVYSWWNYVYMFCYHLHEVPSYVTGRNNIFYRHCSTCRPFFETFKHFWAPQNFFLEDKWNEMNGVLHVVGHLCAHRSKLN